MCLSGRVLLGLVQCYLLTRKEEDTEKQQQVFVSFKLLNPLLGPKFLSLLTVLSFFVHNNLWMRANIIRKVCVVHYAGNISASECHFFSSLLFSGYVFW